jgi:hypothetical protein
MLRSQGQPWPQPKKQKSFVPPPAIAGVSSIKGLTPAKEADCINHPSVHSFEWAFFYK